MEFIITFISLIILIIFHELGHFLLAKKFGVRVEEFGIGYPPRLFGKKFGETIYSLNLIPFGAFVRLSGETEKNDDPKSFSQQSVWKRILIALGGVFSFWIISSVLFAFVFSVGAPVAVEDEADSNLLNPKIQIVDIAKDSPAEKAGLIIGDTIKELEFGGERIIPLKIKEVQDFTNLHLGEELKVTIERGKDVFEVSLTARISPPEGEGAMGVGLVKTAIQKYPWYSAPWQGILTSVRFTFCIIQGYAGAIRNFFIGEPSGIQLTGPIGVFQMLSQSQQLGMIYFLNFLALISLNLAIFNILPIPAVDGGKTLFLLIEAVRKKPVPERIEQKITASCFIILLLLMVWVTINDVSRFF
jgi:regulator of sigma E protease